MKLRVETNDEYEVEADDESKTENKSESGHYPHSNHVGCYEDSLVGWGSSKKERERATIDENSDLQKAVVEFDESEINEVVATPYDLAQVEVESDGARLDMINGSEAVT